MWHHGLVAHVLTYMAIKGGDWGDEFYDGPSAVNTAEYGGRYFQKPATEMMSNIIDFHNDIMVVLIFISVFIAVLLTTCLCLYATVDTREFYLGNGKVSRVTHDSLAEIIFTVVPAAIIYLIAAPSFALLYSNNDWLEKDTEVTVSITGHQWYWNYEYSLDKLYFKNEQAWKDFFDHYYAPTLHNVGSPEAVSHLFSNLDLSDSEKDALFGRITNCHTLMTAIDSADDFDSFMITEEDIAETTSFDSSIFNRSPANKSWDGEKYNFILPYFSLMGEFGDLTGVGGRYAG